MTGSAAVIVPANRTRQGVTIRVVTATSTVYIGGPKVTTSNGFPILTSDTVPITLTTTDAVWGITGGGSIVVAFAEQYQD